MKFILTKTKDTTEVLDGKPVTEEIVLEVEYVYHDPYPPQFTHGTFVLLKGGDRILDPFGPNITLLRADGSFKNLSPKLIRLEP